MNTMVTAFKAFEHQAKIVKWENLSGNVQIKIILNVLGPTQNHERQETFKTKIRRSKGQINAVEKHSVRAIYQTRKIG